MKKFFLIPLLTLMCSVMAWGANVSTWAQLKTAIANPNATITLKDAVTCDEPSGSVIDFNGATINCGGANKFKVSITAAGEWTFKNATFVTTQSSAISLPSAGGVELTLDNIAVQSSCRYGVSVSANTLNIAANCNLASERGIMVANGSTVNNYSNLSTGFYTSSSTPVESEVTVHNYGTITGNAKSSALFKAIMYLYNHTGATYTFAMAGDKAAKYFIANEGNIVYTAKPANINPFPLDAATAAENGIVAACGVDVFTSLATAVEAATEGQTITLWANADAIAVSKLLSINANGFNADAISAGAGYVKIQDGDICTFKGVATIDDVNYTSLASALEAAPRAALITLWADAPATTINQAVVINKNGFSADLTAGAGFVETVEGSYYIYAADASAFASFLASNSTDSYTVTEDIDISLAGTLPVNGTKTLTIPAGKKIFYQRQGLDANILVNEGAKLTILGNGSVEPAQGTEVETSADMAYQMGCWAIRVDGELVVGVEGADQPHFVSTVGRISGANNFMGAAIYVTESGKATINNIDIHASMATFFNAGETEINGGEFISVSSSQSGLGKYSYALQNYGKMVINDIHVKGTHGGFACQGQVISDDVNTGFAQNAVAFINGGSFETVHGKNFITGAENAKDNYYAMYVSNYGVVNVYDGNFKVQTPNAGANRVITIGNNDAYGAYGIVNFYGGKYAAKAYLTKQKNEYNTFPSSIPTTSAWYSTFQNKDDKNSYAPLPAGYEYYETNDATYPWGVRRIPGTETSEIASDETTIPWQQTSTWSTDVVPVTSTIVTIPADATVVVDKDFAGDAVAEQVFVNKGASLTIESGKALTVGDGGINIGFGGSVTVEPGATVKIGEAGIITAEENALVLESTEDAQAILLYDPAVKENTQPKATVKLTTKSKMLAGAPTWQYTYQRFAIPVKEAMIPANDFDPDHDELFPGEESYGFESYVYYWTGHNWANCTWGELVPFKGYQLANNSKNGGVTYTFNGNLFGNEDKAFEFQESGFDYFGNSYTAPINVESFLSGFGADVEATIWLYNYDTKNWQQVALEDLTDGFVDDEFKQIKSMDGFLLNLRAASGSAPVDYENAIWGNPLLPAHAPARNKVTNEINNSAVITVKDNAGFGDNLTLVEKDNYTNAFENGADATKYILPEGVSLYAETLEGKLGRVATNDLNNTIISFRSGDNAEYTLTFGKVNGEDYLLRDNATGMTKAIAEGATYTFTQEANTTVPARFEVIGIAKTPTAIENVAAEAKAHGIYNVAGQFLGNDFTNLPAGVYVVNGVKIVK